MSGVFLSSKNLDFEPLDHKHLNDTYIGWLNDEEVCRYNRHHIFPYSIKKAKAYIDNISHSTSELVLAIIERSTKKHIGNIALQHIDLINKNADISILIGDKEAWGKSYATEAFFVLMHHGFKALNLHRIYCGTSKENIAMQKVAKNIGMKQEGVRRDALFKQNSFTDIVEYGILCDEFDNEKAANYGKKIFF